MSQTFRDAFTTKVEPIVVVNLDNLQEESANVVSALIVSSDTSTNTKPPSETTRTVDIFLRGKYCGTIDIPLDDLPNFVDLLIPPTKQFTQTDAQFNYHG